MANKNFRIPKIEDLEKSAPDYIKSLEKAHAAIMAEAYATVDEINGMRSDAMDKALGLLVESGMDIRMEEHIPEGSETSSVTLYMKPSEGVGPKKPYDYATAQVLEDGFVRDRKEAIGRLDRLMGEGRKFSLALMEFTTLNLLYCHEPPVERTMFYILRPDGVYEGCATFKRGEWHLREPVKTGAFSIESARTGFSKGKGRSQAYILDNPSKVVPAHVMFSYAIDMFCDRDL